VSIGESSIFASLLLTMAACLVLAWASHDPELHHHQFDRAPALLQLGVPLIVSHMFVFYFGIMADLRRLSRWPPSRRRRSRVFPA